MLRLGLAAIAAAFTLVAGSTQAAVIFQDSFSDDDQGGGGFTTVTDLTNWDVVQGNVDILNAGGSYACPTTCIDLDGSNSPAPAILRSKTLYDFFANEQYTLTIDMPRGTQPDSLIFGIDVPGVGVTSETAVNYTFPSTFVMNFSSPTDISAYLYLEMLAPPNNLGPYLNTYTLEGPLRTSQPPAIPLPATAVLLVGALGLLAARRRRTT